MDTNSPASLSDLRARYYHPAMIDAGQLSIKFIIIIIIVIIVVVLLGSCWCWCCCRRRRKRAKKRMAKMRAQKWLKSSSSGEKTRTERFKLPSWTSRNGKKGQSNELGRGICSGQVGQMELPRYSSSSSNIGQLTDVSLEETVVPKRVHKKSWKVWRN